MRRAATFFLALLVLTACFARAAAAQAARETRLQITVVDQSNAVLPTATVTVTGLEDATRKTTLAPVQTGTNGIALMGGLVPGRYSVQAEFPGFASGQLKDVRLRPGDNRHIIVLVIEKMQETVNVGQDAQMGAADRRGSAFGTALTREQVDALSDDPGEMQRQLQDMAGPGAIIRIDSFEGGSLPPKSMIKAIHITRDQFAAENHNAEGLFIDIITQPGVGPIRTNLNYQMHNGAMTARNAFATTKPADQVQNYGFNLSGGLIRNKASFNFGMRGNSSFDNAILAAVLPDGARLDSVKLRSPRENSSWNGNFDYAITRDQTLRLSYSQFDTSNRNLGVGGFNLPERAFLIQDLEGTLGGDRSLTPWALFSAREKAKPFACMLEPPSLNPRIVAQSATFTLCSDQRQSFDCFLEQNGLGSALTKFVIPAQETARFRDQLDLVDVDERRLFPDLDGVAAEMRRYYS